MLLQFQIDDEERREHLVLALTQEGHKVWVERREGLSGVVTNIVFAEIDEEAEMNEQEQERPQMRQRRYLQAISKRRAGLLLESRGRVLPE